MSLSRDCRGNHLISSSRSWSSLLWQLQTASKLLPSLENTGLLFGTL